MLFGKRKRHVKRILIVEDEPLIAFDIETTLGDLGYEVVATLDNYGEAVAALEKGDVDLLLSDIALRGEGDGLALAQRARDAGVPVLFITGRKPQGAEAFALGTLAKPYNDRTLKAALECVDRILGGEGEPKPPKGLDLYPSASGSSVS